MGFLNFSKKKEVPDELPDLVADELGRGNEQEVPEDFFAPAGKSSAKRIPSKTELAITPQITAREIDSASISEQAVPELPNEVGGELDEKGYAEEVKKAVESDFTSEKSFFTDLQKSISSEFSDLNKIEDWYKKDFSKKDVLSEMKEYWEGNKTATIMSTVGKDFKEKIDEKTKRLKELEKEWQKTYFEMVEKEEEIRDEEADLKKILSEFVEVCKRRKKSLDKENNEQKKTKEPRERKKK